MKISHVYHKGCSGKKGNNISLEGFAFKTLVFLMLYGILTKVSFKTIKYLFIF